MKFMIEGKIKPYVRMTQRGKFVKPQAREYLQSKKDIGWQLKQQMVENGWDMLLKQTPVAVTLRFLVPGYLHRSDLDNLIKAVLDAAQGVVFQDDRWVDKIDALRVKGNDYWCDFIVEQLEGPRSYYNGSNKNQG